MENGKLVYTHCSDELNGYVTELMDDYARLVRKAKTFGLDIRLYDNSETLELYFNDDYPDTLLVDKVASSKNKENKEKIMETEKNVAYTEGGVNVAVDSVLNTIDRVSKSAKDAAKQMEVLCEVLKVDPEEFKKAMILKTLKEAAKTGNVDYDGNFYADLLEMVEGLENDNNGLKMHYRSLRDDVDKLKCANYAQGRRLHRIRCAVKHPLLIGSCLDLDKRKYSNSEMLEMIHKVRALGEERLIEIEHIANDMEDNNK